MANRKVWSIRTELLAKSREAALNAVQTFNNPLTTFKTETFIVLMVIAWTSLLHAYYRGNKIEYRYFQQGPKRRKFYRTESGEYKHWELKRCLRSKSCPLDGPVKSNLRFLIGLRNEIEHHRSAGVDEELTGRYLACCLNFEQAICTLFGPEYSLGTEMAVALQFRDLSAVPEATEAQHPLPANVASYLQKFDDSLSAEEFQSPRYSYRLIFTRKLANTPGQADRAIEFIAPDSELAQVINQQYVVLKEVERPKYLPGEITKLMNNEGYPRFGIYQHTALWKSLDARVEGKGFGVPLGGNWYWYDRWVDVVRKHCAENVGKYGP